MALSLAGACAKPPQLLGRCPDRGLVSRGPGQEALVLVLVPWTFRLMQLLLGRVPPPFAPWPGRKMAEETLSGSRPCLSPSTLTGLVCKDSQDPAGPLGVPQGSHHKPRLAPPGPGRAQRKEGEEEGGRVAGRTGGEVREGGDGEREAGRGKQLRPQSRTHKEGRERVARRQSDRASERKPRARRGRERRPATRPWLPSLTLSEIKFIFQESMETCKKPKSASPSQVKEPPRCF